MIATQPVSTSPTRKLKLRVRSDAITQALSGSDGTVKRGGLTASAVRASERTRTADPFITSEVLYQLSYGGGATERVPTRGAYSARMRLLRALGSTSARPSASMTGGT